MTIKTNSAELRRTIRRFKADFKKASPHLINRITEVVKSEINSGILERKLITGGSRSQRLDPATIKAKRKRRIRNGKTIDPSSTPTIPLADTGTMKNVVIVRKATASKPTSIINAPKSRTRLPGTGFNLARHHNEARFGPWFGISPNSRKRAGVLLKEAFRPIFQRFNRG